MLNLALLAAVALASPVVSNGSKCLYCGSSDHCWVGPSTISADLKYADAAVVARFVGQVAKLDPGRKWTEPLAYQRNLYRFEIVEILQGEDQVGKVMFVEALYSENVDPGTTFLLCASKGGNWVWSVLGIASDRSIAYVRQLLKLDDTDPERLQFFREYLEDPDELIAADAFQEFSDAPYADVKAVAKGFDREKLLRWINADSTRASHGRIYLLLLGVIARGNPRPEELAMFDARLNDTAELKPALDAVISCYLAVKWAAGLPLVEDKFLKDKACHYSDTYLAILALRFHIQEEPIIPRQRLLQSLHCLLDRPDLADLIIPDLARWEDWSVMDRLVKLFKDADEKSQWVRIPVIQYLKVCPLPEAKERLDELALLDPDSFRRAVMFVPPKSTDVEAESEAKK